VEPTGDLHPLAADELVRSGAILLDVREPEEFDAGHAPTAVHVPLGDLAQRVGELPTTGTVVCVCRSGGRSAIAAEQLRAGGRDACNLLGGMLAWSSEGLAITASSGASGTVI
jgi:rhodanese-related sulfurtransferase